MKHVWIVWFSVWLGVVWPCLNNFWHSLRHLAVQGAPSAVSWSWPGSWPGTQCKQSLDRTCNMVQHIVMACAQSIAKASLKLLQFYCQWLGDTIFIFQKSLDCRKAASSLRCCWSLFRSMLHCSKCAIHRDTVLTFVYFSTEFHFFSPVINKGWVP